MTIAGVVIGGTYLASTQGNNNTVSNSNLAIAQENPHQATLISVWDQETEPNYSGTREMTVYRSPSCGCCGGWIEQAKKHGFKIEDIKTQEMEALKQK